MISLDLYPVATLQESKDAIMQFIGTFFLLVLKLATDYNTLE